MTRVVALIPRRELVADRLQHNRAWMQPGDARLLLVEVKGAPFWPWLFQRFPALYAPALEFSEHTFRDFIRRA